MHRRGRLPTEWLLGNLQLAGVKSSAAMEISRIAGSMGCYRVNCQRTRPALCRLALQIPNLTFLLVVIQNMHRTVLAVLRLMQ